MLLLLADAMPAGTLGFPCSSHHMHTFAASSRHCVHLADGCLVQVRKAVANVLRLLADAMPPGTLNSQVVMRARFLDWIRDTSLFLKQLPRFGEAFWEVSQVGGCGEARKQCACV
jgi:hypothetical protein